MALTDWLILQYKIMDYIDKINIDPVQRWFNNVAFHLRELHRYHLKE